MQGHIHKRVRTDRHGKETVRWYVVLDLGFSEDGRRRQKWHGGFRTRREAEAARAQLVNDLNTGSYVMPGRITLNEWIRESWLPMTEPRVKPSTFHSYSRNLALHVLPALGRKPLQQLTPPMLTALYGQLAKDTDQRKALSAKTIRYIHSTLHKVLADAVDAGLLGKNVAAGAKPPRPARRATSGINGWEPHELATFLRHLRSARLGPIWRLAAMTGMRRGEVLGLR
jgi:integrase